MKAVLIGISVAGVIVVILGWMYWTDVTTHQANEDFATWNRKIDLVWRVIPIALSVSAVSGVASLFVPPRTRRANVASLIVIGATLLVAGIIWLIMSNLAIR